MQKMLKTTIAAVLAFPGQVFRAFFYVKKNGKGKEFSATKCVAFCLTALAIWNHVGLELWPENHWTVVLSKHGVPSAVIVALIASIDALAAWSLGVYKWAKSKGAA